MIQTPEQGAEIREAEDRGLIPTTSVRWGDDGWDQDQYDVAADLMSDHGLYHAESWLRAVADVRRRFPVIF